MARVIILLAEGFEEIEALTAVDLLRRVNVETEMVSINDSLLVTGARKIQVTADKTMDTADFIDAEMLILPGGMPGTKNLDECEAVIEYINEYIAKKKYVGAICAAPTVLGKRGLLKGKKACCYPDMEDMLLEAKISFDEVCVDGKIITSRGLGTATAFALKLVEIMTDKATADKLAKSVVYRA